MNSVPQSMRFVTVPTPGGPEVLVLDDAPVPIPSDGEVLIHVAAAGVNRADIAQRQGVYPPPAGASKILGLEVAGTIAAVGANTSPWQVGDAVCALTPGGGYAEYCLAPSPQCLPIPEGLSLVEAAALPEAFLTVWPNVFERGRLAAGETFLVHGGTSGIGTTAIQLAAAFGARVITTAGSDEKCAACVALGADAAINYRTGDFVTRVKELTSSRGVDLILDMVGAEYLPKNMECLAPDGRLVQIAMMQGASAALDIRVLMQKRLTLTGSMLRPLSIEEKGRIARELVTNVWPLLENGRIKPIVDSTYPLAAVAEAHKRMESSAHIGKIVLVM